MKIKKKQILILFALIFLPGLIFIRMSKLFSIQETLPIIGIKTLDQNKDTVYHTISDFSFLTQDSIIFSSSDTKEKFIVFYTFFSSCPSICPTITTNLKQYLFGSDNLRKKNVWVLGISIDPRRDIPSKLKEFEQQFELEQESWKLLTGTYESIKNFVLHEIYLPVKEERPEIDSGDIYHSSMMVLVDKKNHIRGIYDALKTEDFEKLIDDIQLLKAVEIVEKRK